jgi:PPM family protein phosphatase
MLLAAETTCKTDIGRQRRDNEDSAFARAPVFVVADGMGGAQAGEVAARIAIEAFEHGLPGGGSPEERLANLVREANHQIYERSRADRGRAGMGTTLTAAYVDDANVAIAHVGDSRAYLFRDGSLQRLTQDHSLVGELVRRGKLSEEQAAEHPRRSIITRALGLEPDVEVDTWTYPARAGDVILLCSDGLTSMISEERVRDILESNPNLDAVADTLINEANEAGGATTSPWSCRASRSSTQMTRRPTERQWSGSPRPARPGATRAAATTRAVPPAPTNPVARWRSRWPCRPCDKNSRKHLRQTAAPHSSQMASASLA